MVLQISEREINKIVSSILPVQNTRKTRKRKPRKPITRGKGNTSSRRIHPRQPVQAYTQETAAYIRRYGQQPYQGTPIWSNQIGVENLIKRCVADYRLSPYELKLYFKTRDTQEYIMNITGSQLV